MGVVLNLVIFLHLQAFMRDMPLFHGSLDLSVAVNINMPLLNALFGVPQ